MCIRDRVPGPRAVPGWRGGPPSGLAENAVHLRAADRTGALSHSPTGLADLDRAFEIALVFALHAIAVVCLGHVTAHLRLAYDRQPRSWPGPIASLPGRSALTAQLERGWAAPSYPAADRGVGVWAGRSAAPTRHPASRWRPTRHPSHGPARGPGTGPDRCLRLSSASGPRPGGTGRKPARAGPWDG